MSVIFWDGDAALNWDGQSGRFAFQWEVVARRGENSQVIEGRCNLVGARHRIHRMLRAGGGVEEMARFGYTLQVLR